MQNRPPFIITGSHWQNRLNSTFSIHKHLIKMATLFINNVRMYIFMHTCTVGPNLCVVTHVLSKILATATSVHIWGTNRSGHLIYVTNKINLQDDGTLIQDITYVLRIMYTETTSHQPASIDSVPMTSNLGMVNILYGQTWCATPSSPNHIMLKHIYHFIT